jgi:hypothetical protein
MQQIAGSRRILRRNRGPKPPHHGAHARPVGAVNFGALTGLLRTLQYRLFPLLDLTGSAWHSYRSLSVLLKQLTLNDE